MVSERQMELCNEVAQLVTVVTIIFAVHPLPCRIMLAAQIQTHLLWGASDWQCRTGPIAVLDP